MNDTRAEAVVRTSLQRALDLMRAKEDELGQLDAVAGDGDHGAAMVRGMQAAVEAVAGIASATPGTLLVEAGTAFADAGGGASGALFGAFLCAVGRRLGGGPYDPAAVCAALQAGEEMVCKLGKTKPGDKTLVDSLDPFVTAFAASALAYPDLATAWLSALPAAEQGAEATAELVARRGRSSRLGERSRGHRDPGAVSMYYLLLIAGQTLNDLCRA